MVVLCQWPVEAGACAKPSEPILDIVVHGGHIACLTETTVQLWLSGPHAKLIGWAEHDKHEISQIGRHCRLAWHPNGRTVAVTVLRPSAHAPRYTASICANGTLCVAIADAAFKRVVLSIRCSGHVSPARCSFKRGPDASAAARANGCWAAMGCSSLHDGRQVRDCPSAK